MNGLAKHLRRRTTSGNWMPEIDGLRFVAIAAVLLFHMQGELRHHGVHPVQLRYQPIANVIDTGNRGVQLFFVISGYILARPFASRHLLGKRRPTLGKYLLRRVTRLEPPYILNLLVCAGCFLVLDHVPWRTLLRELVVGVAYQHYLFRNSVDTLNSVAWSLEVEVQFYLLAPLLTLVFAVKRALLRRSLLVAGMLASAWAQTAFHFTFVTLAGQLQYFLAGLLLVDLVITVMQHWSHDARWDVVSLLGWPLVFLPVGQGVNLWLPFLILLLYVAALRGRVFYRLLRLEWVALSGGMCYTIYLWHPLVLSFIQGYLDRVAGFLPTDYAAYFILQAVPKLIAVAVVSVIMFVAVERPCMDPEWPRKLMRAMRGLNTRPAHAAHAVSLEES